MNFRDYCNKKQSDIENDTTFIITTEGVNIDTTNKCVYVDLTHENNVDTSVAMNPTYSNIDGYDVVSIFKRKHNDDKSDGNPLVYALKNIKGWKIDKKDIIKLLHQFVDISNKIDSKYDTIISIPSSNDLNNKFLYRLNRIIKCDDKITDHLFSKMYVDEVVENIDYPSMTSDEISIMDAAIRKIKDKHFTFKSIPVDLRKYIKNIWDDSFSCSDLGVADKINDKNILILDDTIASGQTISTFCDTILKNYAPKSVTIITLFSAL